MAGTSKFGNRQPAGRKSREGEIFIWTADAVGLPFAVGLQLRFKNRADLSVRDRDHKGHRLTKEDMLAFALAWVPEISAYYERRTGGRGLVGASGRRLSAKIPYQLVHNSLLYTYDDESRRGSPTPSGRSVENHPEWSELIEKVRKLLRRFDRGTPSTLSDLAEIGRPFLLSKHRRRVRRPVEENALPVKRIL